MIETSFRTLLLLKKMVQNSLNLRRWRRLFSFSFFLPDYSPPITKQNDIKDAFIFSEIEKNHAEARPDKKRFYINTIFLLIPHSNQLLFHMPTKAYKNSRTSLLPFQKCFYQNLSWVVIYYTVCYAKNCLAQAGQNPDLTCSSKSTSMNFESRGLTRHGTSLTLPFLHQ